MKRLRTTGSILVVIGGLLFVCALAFLPYFESHLFNLAAGFEPTLWDLATREPVILTVVAAAAIAFGVGSVVSGASIFPLAATWSSLYLLGQVFFDGQPTYIVYGSGFWLATGAAAVMAAGSIAAVVGAGLASRFATPS